MPPITLTCRQPYLAHIEGFADPIADRPRQRHSPELIACQLIATYSDLQSQRCSLGEIGIPQIAKPSAYCFI